MQRFGLFSLLSLLFVSPAVSAQDVVASVRVSGATIVVTADRISEPIEDATDSVSIITAEDLQRSQLVTVAEALRDIAGMNVVRSGSPGHTTSAFLRGASSSQVLLLIDGIEINDPFFGGADIGSLLTSGVERIEIVRGSQSPLYGSQAMAGVVNIVTASRDIVTDDVDGTLRVETGSMSTHTESAQLAGGWEALQWKAGGSFLSTAGQFDNDEFRNVQLNGRLQRNLTADSTLALHAFAGDSHTGIPFNGPAPALKRNSESQLAVGGIEYVLHASPLLGLEIRGSVTDRDDAFEDPEDFFATSSTSESKMWRGMVQNTMTPRGQTIVFGVEHKIEDVLATSNEDVALDETIRTTAFYAQDRVELGALRITGGARLDRHSRFGGHTSPRVSAAYERSKRWRLRAAAGRAFRAPSAGELAYPFYGNPDLDPETSRSVEAGVDFDTPRVSLSLTAFNSKYDGLISFDPVTFVAANIDRATIRGAELSAGARFGERWHVAAGYTHLQTRDEGTGLPLYRRPRNAASVTLSYARADWTASGNVNAVGPRFERDFETFSDRYNDGYVKFDVAASYRLRHGLQLTSRIENVFDREYAEALAFPAPGRTVNAGVHYAF